MGADFLAVSGGLGLMVSFGVAGALSSWERRPLSDYGLGFSEGGRQATGGAIFGLTAMSLAVAVLIGLGALDPGFAHIGRLRGLGRALASVGAFSLVAAAQESVFRGWLLAGLARRIGFSGGSAITSALFVAVHLTAKGETELGLGGLFVFALLACAATRVLGSIWWAVGFHAAWDFALTFLFGFGAPPEAESLIRMTPRGPVWLSGGSGGPEGSLITVAILLALWAFVASRRKIFPEANHKTNRKTNR